MKIRQIKKSIEKIKNNIIYIMILIPIILITVFFSYTYINAGIITFPKFKTTEKISWIENNKFVVKNGNKIEKFTIKGVNLGLSLPGTYPTERSIDKKTYLKWFKQIEELGANTIKLYTIADDEFYEALYEYNKANKDNPLYLMQGVWIDDDIYTTCEDAYELKFKRNFFKNTKNTIDAVHGNLEINDLERSGNQNYEHDVSNWVIGYIFGVEWESDMISNTNKKHSRKRQYDGKYIYTENASSFEICLAKLTDKVLNYESNKYGQSRNFSISNWTITDPFKYSYMDEIFNEKYSKLDVENIKTKKNFKSNQFASYHVYPYYPEFDSDNKSDENLYRKYISKLNSHHKLPVVISEFGAPSSRGISSYEQNISLGRNQGNMSEEEQGNAIVSMYEDIMKSGSAGAIVFSWQDEWFKKSWNTSKEVDVENSAFWCDYQTSEQHFGLLSFDLGLEKSKSYPDGDKSEWKKNDIIQDKQDLSISAKYDEKYLYFMIDLKGKNPENEELFVPIDTIQKIGAKEANRFNIKSNREMDFVINIVGKTDSKLFVQDRYEKTKALYSDRIYKNQKQIPSTPNKDSKNFEVVKMILSEKDYYMKNKEIEVDKSIKNKRNILDKLETKSQLYETGNLIYGNGNPNSKEFNSLSDYCFGEDFIEIRIPWGMLNFCNPSRMEINDDYYEQTDLRSQKIDKMYIGIGKYGEKIDLEKLELKGWGNDITYHERLKKSYYILKEFWNKEEE